MKLDTATNLPKLPEGQYWSVQKLPGRGFSVAVMRDVTTHWGCTPRENWWSNWFLGPVYNPPTTTHEVVVVLDVNDPAKESAWKTEYAEYEESCKRVGRFYPYYPSADFAADHLTNELVLVTAKKCMDTLKARQRARDLVEADNAFLGTYPPNKLDGAK